MTLEIDEWMYNVLKISNFLKTQNVNLKEVTTKRDND